MSTTVVFPTIVEDVELAVDAGTLAGNEPRSFGKGEDRQDDVGGGASIDRRLLATVRVRIALVR